MSRSTPRRCAIALTVFTTLFLTACGRDDGDVVLGTVPSPTSTTTTASSSSTPASTATPFTGVQLEGLAFVTYGRYNGQSLTTAPGAGSGTRTARNLTVSFSGNTAGSLRNLTLRAASSSDFFVGEVIDTPAASLSYVESFDTTTANPRSWASTTGRITITRVTAGAIEFDFTFVSVEPVAAAQTLNGNLNGATGTFDFSGHVVATNATPSSGTTTTTTTSSTSTSSATETVTTQGGTSRAAI